MRCFKLLGERIMARDFDHQVAELQVRAAVLNRFTRLGTPITVTMASFRREKAAFCLYLICTTKPKRSPNSLTKGQSSLTAHHKHSLFF